MSTPMPKWARRLLRRPRKKKGTAPLRREAAPGSQPLTRAELVRSLEEVAARYDAAEAEAGGLTPCPKASLLRAIAASLGAE